MIQILLLTIIDSGFSPKKWEYRIMMALGFFREAFWGVRSFVSPLILNSFSAFFTPSCQGVSNRR
jgi:hypothetical protein